MRGKTAKQAMTSTRAKSFDGTARNFLTDPLSSDLTMPIPVKRFISGRWVKDKIVWQGNVMFILASARYFPHY